MICERCWADAYGRMMGNGRSQYDNYRDLLREREANPCSPEQQRGESATPRAGDDREAPRG